MKRVVIAFVALIGICLSGFAQSEEENDVELKEVIEAINFSLKVAQHDLKGISLDEASVTLQTISLKSGGGGFKIFVKAKRKWSREISNSVTFSFKKPKEGNEKAALKKTDLAQMIIDAARQFRNSVPVDGLVKAGFEVEVSFSLKKSTELGVEFKIYDIGFDISGDIDKTVFHKIVLKFS